jgi:hypothetical protein
MAHCSTIISCATRLRARRRRRSHRGGGDSFLLRGGPVLGSTACLFGAASLAAGALPAPRAWLLRGVLLVMFTASACAFPQLVHHRAFPSAGSPRLGTFRPRPSHFFTRPILTFTAPTCPFPQPEHYCRHHLFPSAGRL